MPKYHLMTVVEAIEYHKARIDDTDEGKSHAMMARWLMEAHHFRGAMHDIRVRLADAERSTEGL